MNRYLTLAACQSGAIQRGAARAETVGRLVQLLESAAKAGAELVVFPELALTTFFPRWPLEDRREIDAFYETAMPGPETRPLYDAARRLRIGFAIGYAELLLEDGRRRRVDRALPKDAHTGHSRRGGGRHGAPGAPLF
jgi:predicted amidohydrolase